MIVPEKPPYWGGEVHESMYHLYRKFVAPYAICQSPFNPVRMALCTGFRVFREQVRWTIDFPDFNKHWLHK